MGRGLLVWMEVLAGERELWSVRLCCRFLASLEAEEGGSVGGGGLGCLLVCGVWMKRKVWVFGCPRERGKEEVGCGFFFVGKKSG